MKVSFFFALYDFWVGFFYDQKKHILYFCPLPCFVVKFERKLTKRAPDVLKCGHNQGVEYGENSVTCVVCGEPARR